MKKLLLLFLIPISAFAQTNIRWDLTAQTVTGHGQMVPVLALPGAFINFYTGCTHLPCTTAATTYISASSASTCPANAQVVWQLPLSQTCGAQADSQGNFGGYFQPGAYQYTITVSGHVNGPYQFNVGGTGGGGGVGCTLGIIGDTDVLSVHPQGTCYGSSTFTWDTASGNQNLIIGDLTHVTNANESYQIGPNNLINNSALDFNLFTMGTTNTIHDTTGTADSIDTVNILGSTNTVMASGTSGTVVNQVGILGYSNSITATGANNIFAAYILGIGNTIENDLGATDDVFIVGNNNDADAAPSTVDIIGALNQASNVSYDNPLDVNQAIVGGNNLVKHTGGGTYSDYFEVLGHENYEHDCFDCIAIGSGVEVSTNDLMGIGFSRIPELQFIGSNVRRTPLTFALPGPINTAEGTSHLPVIPNGTTCTVTFTGGTGSSGTGSIYVTNNVDSINHYQIQITAGGSYSVAPTGGTLSGGTGCTGTITVHSTIAVVQACSAGLEGSFASITDSTTGALGATITGGGSTHVFGYCNGTNWIVAAGSTPLVSPLTTKGDIWVYGSGDTRLPVGTNGQVLSANSAQTTGLQWISALTNPMSTLGDIIYGGVAGAATRLAGPTAASTVCLTSTGTGSAAQAPSWGSCAGSAATALSSITAASTNATINSVNNPIVWNWAQTTNSQSAFTFGENTAASGTGDVELTVSTAAGSTAIPVSITQSLNGAQTLPALSVTPTWNTSGVVDAAILVNATNTASGAASKLFDLQVGGTSKFAVDKAGIVTNGTWQGVAIANAFLANPATTVNGQTCTLGSTCTTTGNTTNALTMNALGSGAGPGTTFNGSAGVTLSYNTIGAAPTASPTFTGTITTPVTGSTQCLQVNSSGVIGGTGAACGSGGGGGFAGTVTYTTSHTLSSVGSQCAVGGNDNGCLIIMNCSSACSLTLPNPQPTSTMLVGVISKGSSIATIILGSSMTYNGGLTAPVLLSNSQISVASNSSVSTDYVGTTPFKAGSGTTITSSTANQTVAISGAQATVGSAEVVAFSATPTFSAAFNVSRIVLSGNITSFTMAGAGTDGTLKTLCFQQGGGAYTVAAPGNVHGFFTVGTISTDWNCQSFAWDNTDSIWLATSAGVINQ